MNHGKRWALVAMMVLAVAASQGASLGGGPRSTPESAWTAFGPSLLGLIEDGSFELGPPPASGWTEVNDSNCERIGDFAADWYMSSWDGYQDYWAGGYCLDDSSGQNVPVNSFVSQVISVPADSSLLTFYYVSYRTSADDVPDDGDHAYVSINGVEVWNLPFLQVNNTYPTWTPAQVNLAAYAGQTVTLALGAVSVGSETGNLRFDSIALTAAVPVDAQSWGKIKTLYVSP